MTVYIAGYGALIDSGVFQKAFPENQGYQRHWLGHSARAAHRRRAARRKISCRCLQRRRQFALSESLSRQDARSAQAGADLARSCRSVNWWEGKQKYVDREGRYIFVYEGNVAAGASPAYNTNLINPKDYKSLWDFLNPKLKGKIVSPDIRRTCAVSGPSLQYLYYHADLGPEFIAAFLQRNGCDVDGRFSPGDGLARGRESCVVDADAKFLYGQSQSAGVACGRIRSASF